MNFSKKKKLTANAVWAMFAETARRQEENRQLQMETDRLQKENALAIKELRASNKELSANIGGISNSNGRFAEEYFYNSLERQMEFAGVHFDDIDDRFKRSIKMPDGSKLKDQFDIVMTNEKAVALIEVKYKASYEYVEDLATRKVANFRTLFPDYKDFSIYLGLGSLAFDEKTVSKAREYGIGLLKQVGETIVYNADWKVRAY